MDATSSTPVVGGGQNPTAESRLNQPRLSMWEVLGVVTSFRQNVERLKLYRASVSVVRFLSILNLTYTLVGAAFLILAFCPQWTTDFSDQQRFQFMKLGNYSFILKTKISYIFLNQGPKRGSLEGLD